MTDENHNEKESGQQTDWTVVRDIFNQAIEKPVEEHETFLDDKCFNDNKLRSKVDSLLKSHYQAADFLERPPDKILGDEDYSTAADTFIGKQIGRYSITEIIATGGMGIIYKARQFNPDRIVALKLMRRAIVSRSAIARFRQEVQVLGKLRHACIAKIFDAGMYYEESAHEGGTGLPYFVMEYLPGAMSICKYAQSNNLSLSERLELFVLVCDAVHHGHQRGIIHRDLKPGNIVVDSTGQLKVIDFGVARITDSDMGVSVRLTNTGQLIGTLQYMSPEQCDKLPHNVDIRSDIYSLGVVLYELVSGELPYELIEQSLYQSADTIRKSEPKRLSHINHSFHGDIEIIIMKALEKEPRHRYQSAADLGRDLQRYLNKEAIAARPPTTLYRVSKYVQRHRIGTAITISIIGLFIVSFILSISYNIKIRVAKADGDAVTEIVYSMLGMSNLAQFRDKNNFITVIDKAEKKINTVFADYPLREARIRHLFGLAYKNLGESSLAIQQYELAYQVYSEYGDTEQQLTSLLYDMGRLYLYLSRYEESEESLLFVCENAPQYFDSPSDNLYQPMDLKAQAVRAQGRYKDAEILANEVLETANEVLQDKLIEALAKENLALLLSDMGQVDIAESYAEAALEIRLEKYGIYHLYTAWSFHNYALIIRDMGRLEEAFGLQDQCYKIRFDMKGETQQFTLLGRTNRAITLTKMERYEEAEKELRECLRLQMIELPDYHEDLLTTRFALFDLFMLTDRRSEALSMGQEILDSRIEIGDNGNKKKILRLGETHRERMRLMTLLTRLFIDEGQLDDAEIIAEIIYYYRGIQFGDNSEQMKEAVKLLDEIRNLRG